MSRFGPRSPTIDIRLLRSPVVHLFNSGMSKDPWYCSLLAVNVVYHVLVCWCCCAFYAGHLNVQLGLDDE